MIDWSISLGNLLTLAGFLGGGVLFVFAVRRDVDVLSQRFIPLEQAVVRLTDILVELGRQDVRLNNLEDNQIRRYPARKRRQSSPG